MDKDELALPMVDSTKNRSTDSTLQTESHKQRTIDLVTASEIVYCPREILSSGFIAQRYRFKIDQFNPENSTSGHGSASSSFFGDPAWAWQVVYFASPDSTTVAILAANCVDGILDYDLPLSRNVNSIHISIMVGDHCIRTFRSLNAHFTPTVPVWNWSDSDIGRILNRHPQVFIECRLLYRDSNAAETNRLILNKIAQSHNTGADMTDNQIYVPSTTRTEVKRDPVSALQGTAGSESCNNAQPRPQPPDMPHFEFKSQSDVPYKFISELGVGSSSRVDEVQHSFTKKRYARKSIRCHTSEAETVREIILREVGVVQRLSHDHIVSVFCTYREPRSFNLLITPVAAGDLSWYLDRVSDENYPASSLELLRTWFACLTRALAYVHENMIRHKDIKPGNILVDGSNVLLTDFGIARDFINEFTSSTQNGYSAKTLMYCAPEVDDDDGQRSRSADVFSLGCVFAEMATVLAKKSVADFYLMRKVGESHAYFRTLELVQSWMATHTVLPYSRFIALMLSPNKAARPSAALVEMLIQIGGLDGKTGISCPHG